MNPYIKYPWFRVSRHLCRDCVEKLKDDEMIFDLLPKRDISYVKFTDEDYMCGICQKIAPVVCDVIIGEAPRLDDPLRIHLIFSSRWRRVLHGEKKEKGGNKHGRLNHRRVSGNR